MAGIPLALRIRENGALMRLAQGHAGWQSPAYNLLLVTLEPVVFFPPSTPLPLLLTDYAGIFNQVIFIKCLFLKRSGLETHQGNYREAGIEWGESVACGCI